MSSNIILPMGHDKTLTIFEWYFHEGGGGEAWEGVQQAVAFSDEIQQEDIVICENVQRGLASRVYSQGRFSAKRENGVHHFHSLGPMIVVEEWVNTDSSAWQRSAHGNRGRVAYRTR